MSDTYAIMLLSFLGILGVTGSIAALRERRRGDREV